MRHNLGGKEGNKYADKKQRRGRGPGSKQAVVGRRECTGTVHAMPVEGADEATLHGMIAEHVDKEATIYTDEHAGYRDLPYCP